MKTIVITGTTSGIGNLLVKEFIKRGCRVFAGYRNIKLKKELEKISENVIPFRIDMSKEWTISDAAKFICEQLGDATDLHSIPNLPLDGGLGNPSYFSDLSQVSNANRYENKIDALINAAGCVIVGPMECLDVDKIREQFEVNTFSHLSFTQKLFDKLIGGKIINISSTSSFGIYPFIAPYCASKRTLDMLFNSMQIECQGGVRVISIKPGVIKTPLWEKSIELNKDVLGDNKKYEKEFNYLMKNAEKNKGKGLDAQKVVDLVIKVESLKNPKSSYVIGIDAKIAEIISHLPQDWINFIVKEGLKHKMY